ncbi:MAG: hypothetical protein F4020_00320 [Gammaproteobacteria bacterium]|nr:hypothetical protein [Gammaproteobacteria bacterium]MYK68054.1 hypothetical protein [Gammaproteobacteria bacterium]
MNQVRVGLDLSLPARLGDLELTPSGTVHARRDGGAGQTGDGIEVAGRLQAVLGIVRLDAQARMLVHHTAEGYGERGAAVTLALGRQGGEEGSRSRSRRAGAAWPPPRARSCTARSAAVSEAAGRKRTDGPSTCTPTTALVCPVASSWICEAATAAWSGNPA